MDDISVENVFYLLQSSDVPEWMFLSWVAQLLAHLDTEIGHVVAPLLLRLATSYPTAVQFPFHLSREMYQYNNPGTRSAVDQYVFTDNNIGVLEECICGVEKFLIFYMTIISKCFVTFSFQYYGNCFM
jgi:hypothetical protein